MPHGVLRRSRRQRADAPPPLRAAPLSARVAVRPRARRPLRAAPPTARAAVRPPARRPLRAAPPTARAAARPRVALLRGLALAAVLLTTLGRPAAGSAAPAEPRPGPVRASAAAAAGARAGLARAVAGGHLSQRSARRWRAVLRDAEARLARLPPGRAGVLGAVLAEVSGHAAVYDEPRALALFTMLGVNARALARRSPGRADIAGADGTIYRPIAGRGWQVHPLAAFARLNALLARGRRARAARLATALMARAVPAGTARAWEYYFPFGGPRRWTSALAQAAAAQALARAGARLRDPSASSFARAAFLAIPGALARPLAGGAWVREYSWSPIAILNAQLQSIVSLGEYARRTGDSAAAGFARRLSAAALRLLPAFDTGCWSRYALGGAPASRHYHAYHVDLLQRLAARDPAWRATAVRWSRYLRGDCA